MVAWRPHTVANRKTGSKEKKRNRASPEGLPLCEPAPLVAPTRGWPPAATPKPH